MKLIFATTAIIATVFLPLAAARLRGAARGIASTVASEEADMVNALNRKKANGWHTIFGLELEMQNFDEGNDGVPSYADEDVVAAYKEAVGEVFEGFVMKWVVVDNEVANSDAKKLTRYGGYYHLVGSGGCRLCSRGVSGTVLTGKTDSFMHDKRWEKVGPLICEKLKMTGHKAFAKVDGCAAHPSYASVSDVEEQLTELAPKAAMEESAKSDITFSGDLDRKKANGWHTIFGLELEMQNFDEGNDGVPSYADEDVVAAYKEAVGEVFEGFVMKWVVVDNEVANSDAEKLTRYGGYYHLVGSGGCRLCRRGVSGTELTGKTDSFMHDKRWEKVGPLICEKLKMTGHKAFAKVDGCAAHPSYASVTGGGGSF